MTLPPNRRRRWSGSKNQFFPASYLFLCFFPRKISKLVRMVRTEIEQVRDTQNQQLQVDQVETRDDAELLPDEKWRQPILQSNLKDRHQEIFLS